MTHALPSAGLGAVVYSHVLGASEPIRPAVHGGHRDWPFLGSGGLRVGSYGAPFEENRFSWQGDLVPASRSILPDPV